MNIKISKIEIIIGDDTLSLTLEQAKELREVLDRELGERKEYVPYPVYPHWREYPIITWGGVSGTTAGTEGYNKYLG